MQTIKMPGKFAKFLKNAPLKLTIGLSVLLLLALFAIIIPILYPGDPVISYQVPMKLRPSAE